MCDDHEQKQVALRSGSLRRLERNDFLVRARSIKSWNEIRMSVVQAILKVVEMVIQMKIL